VSYKILLADNSVTVQKIIKLTFSDEGVDVIAVNNGAEAINRLRRMRPALVMADISIPGRNGYEICEFVKNHADMKQTPVILLVPAFERFDEDRARRIGADCHLTKPFQSIRMLISIVKNLIDHKGVPDPPVAGDGLTTPREGYKNKYNTAELNSRRARIDKLLNMSVQPATENVVENGDPLKANPRRANGRRSDSPQVKNAPCEVEITEDVNMDNILELDDVLPHPPSIEASGQVTRRVMKEVIEPDAIADHAQRHVGVVHFETIERPIIPQSVIDEIVDRISAQLSAQLIERLSGEIARRVAPEVAELVRRQLFAEPPPYRDPENLLDID
jgi:CheY-like chemotaxis protein